MRDELNSSRREVRSREGELLTFTKEASRKFGEAQETIGKLSASHRRDAESFAGQLNSVSASLLAVNQSATSERQALTKELSNAISSARQREHALQQQVNDLHVRLEAVSAASVARAYLEATAAVGDSKDDRPTAASPTPTTVKHLQDRLRDALALQTQEAAIWKDEATRFRSAVLKDLQDSKVARERATEQAGSNALAVATERFQSVFEREKIIAESLATTG